MSIPDPTLEIRVVHEGERYVVIDKPSGMLSVPGKGPEKADCVAARVRAAFPRAKGPLVPHRLDMDTSGLMVLALDPKALADLGGQFERRTVEKRYVALLARSPRGGGETGVVDLPIRADIENRPYQIHDPDRGRPSRTEWRVLAREIDRTRVLFRPVTGRAHQLRVHAAHPLGLGAPILGDVLYGPDHPAERLMLHAFRLAFNEPGTRRRVVFESPTPF